MVGSTIYNKLKNTDCKIVVKTKKQLDLTDEKKVYNFFKKNSFDYVYICAAKVGGVLANKNSPVDFFVINQKIQLNIINSAFKNGIKNLIFLGSSCIYPANYTNIKEKDLLKDKLDVNNDGYALSKITGVKLCEFYMRQFPKKKLKYISLMPCNLFGPNDNFDKTNSHVLAALIRKIFEAKKNNKKYIEIWGNGKPRREFMHVDEVADASIYFMNLSLNKFRKYCSGYSHINIGYGKDISIIELAKLITKYFNFKTKFKFNRNKPNGVLYKKLNVNLMKKFGFKPKREFKKSLKVYIDEIIKEKKLI